MKSLKIQNSVLFTPSLLSMIIEHRLLQFLRRSLKGEVTIQIARSYEDILIFYGVFAKSKSGNKIKLIFIYLKFGFYSVLQIDFSCKPFILSSCPGCKSLGVFNKLTAFLFIVCFAILCRANAKYMVTDAEEQSLSAGPRVSQSKSALPLFRKQNFWLTYPNNRSNTCTQKCPTVRDLILRTAQYSNTHRKHSIMFRNIPK